MKIYDETAYRELKTDSGFDTFYLHCRLFKFTEQDQRYATASVERWSGYLLVEDYRSYVGEPGDNREKSHQRRKLYVKGPDHIRIRHVIGLLDSFKKPTE